MLTAPSKGDLRKIALDARDAMSEAAREAASGKLAARGLPFEIASVLLLVAIVGSILLARTAKQEVATDDLDPFVVEELETTGELTPAEVEEALQAHDVRV